MFFMFISVHKIWCFSVITFNHLLNIYISCERNVSRPVFTAYLPDNLNDFLVLFGLWVRFVCSYLGINSIDLFALIYLHLCFVLTVCVATLIFSLGEAAAYIALTCLIHHIIKTKHGEMMNSKNTKRAHSILLCKNIALSVLQVHLVIQFVSAVMHFNKLQFIWNRK